MEGDPECNGKECQGHLFGHIVAPFFRSKKLSYLGYLLYLFMIKRYLPATVGLVHSHGGGGVDYTIIFLYSVLYYEVNLYAQ